MFRLSLPRTLPTPSSLPASQQQQLRTISLPSLSSLFRRKSKSDDIESDSSSSSSSTASSSTASASVEPKSLFDIEADQVSEVVRQEAAARRKPVTFHKSSTANFKHSRRKLNDLANLIAGKTVDEGILQLQMSPKKSSSRLLSMLTLSRSHAISKGLSRSNLIIAQSWTTQGPSLPRLDIKGRGRHGVKHHPSSKLHVLLAEGRSEEERRRHGKREQWRMGVRGVAEGGAGVGVGMQRKIVNSGVGGWKW